MKDYRVKAWLCAALVAFSCLSSCKKDDPTDEVIDTVNFDRQALLSNLADIIEDAHQVHNLNTQTLRDAVVSFNASPSSSTLQDCQALWHQTLLDWQFVAPFEFGTATTLSFEASHNTYPVEATQIDNNIVDGGYDLDAAANLDAIGLQAIDYLLFGQSEAQTIDNFSTDVLAAERAQYLLDLCDHMLGKSNILYSMWTSGSQQRADFVLNDGTDQGSSLGLFLNAYNKSFERSTRTNKLGIPTGALTFSMTPNPGHVEAYYENNHSVAYLKASVQAFRNLYEGGTGIGFDDYLIALNAQHGAGTLQQAIIDQLNLLDTELNSLQEPLSDFVVNDQQVALDVYAELQELVVLWKVDMMSALGVLITYQDNDGD